MWNLKQIPEGKSYVAIARSKSATMRRLLETVERGSRYWTSGVVSLDKAEALAAKFAALYDTDRDEAKRCRMKAKGYANAQLIMYPRNDQDCKEILWWLLVTPGKGEVHQREALKDTHDKRQLLRWEDQYELKHMQHSTETGGGRHWTWRCCEENIKGMRDKMLALCSGPDKPNQTRDKELHKLISSMLLMPGYYGIRQQVMQLLYAGEARWNQMHKAPYLGWPDAPPPYTDKRPWVYHRPHKLKLDILVKRYA